MAFAVDLGIQATYYHCAIDRSAFKKADFSCGIPCRLLTDTGVALLVCVLARKGAKGKEVEAGTPSPSPHTLPSHCGDLRPAPAANNANGTRWRRPHKKKNKPSCGLFCIPDLIESANTLPVWYPPRGVGLAGARALISFFEDDEETSKVWKLVLQDSALAEKS